MRDLWRTMAHKYLIYRDKGRREVGRKGKCVCICMYVIQHVSVWACCHAQAVCLKPPTRVKPWFYRASKREIGCSTALLLLLLLSTPSLSDVPRSVCCRWFKDKCDTLCLWNHWNGVSFLTNLAAKSDSHLQKKMFCFCLLILCWILNLQRENRPKGRVAKTD